METRISKKQYNKLLVVFKILFFSSWNVGNGWTMTQAGVAAAAQTMFHEVKYYHHHQMEKLVRASAKLLLPGFTKTMYPNLRDDQQKQLVDDYKLMPIIVKDDDTGKSDSMHLDWDCQGYKLLGVACLLRDRGIMEGNQVQVSCINGEVHFSLVKYHKDLVQ